MPGRSRRSGRTARAGSARSGRSDRWRSCCPRWPSASCSTREGAQALFWVYLPFLLATAFVTAAIPRRGAGTNRSVNLLRGAGGFLAKPGMLLFFGGFTVVWAALAATNAFYSIQIVALGGSPGLVGIAWAIGASIEVPFMYAFPRIGARFGTERLVVAGALAFVLRELLAALIADPVVLVLVAPLEGLGFSCVFVGGVTVVAARAPAGLGGTAQGLFSASAGLATILGSLGGGAVAGGARDPRAVRGRRGRRADRRGHARAGAAATPTPIGCRPAGDRRRGVTGGHVAPRAVSRSAPPRPPRARGR